FFFSSKPCNQSTLPGICSQSVNYKTDSNVELKKAVCRTLNVNGLEKESGLICLFVLICINKFFI
uniref:Ovule protein n=1 Tax=Ascaris lumbricoides TaxID=6252 RepID=A0A0M3HGS0_ASCLU